MKMRTRVRAAGVPLNTNLGSNNNHNQTLKVRTGVKAGIVLKGPMTKDRRG